eukprot:TRINITY_DN1270_c0_g2_i1.p1 TRINITY_DN1270_c0_g2~~TRINITY_DN1270_c0_g2_i1.p1  ORF type:complete len:234 (-),score=33.18 TRINITY_DN1270_c0_g2_i1:37-738(-)
MVRSEGYFSFYRGVSSPLLFGMIHNAVIFYSRGQIEYALRKYHNITTGELPLSFVYLSGLLTGIPISFVETPMELMKIKLQTRKNISFASYLPSIIKNNGFRGLYQGYVPCLLRAVPQFGGYFLGFEYVSRKLTHPGKELSYPACFLAGSFAGLACWVYSYPVEIIKTHIQQDHFVKSQRQYHGMIDCGKQIYAKQGIKGFFKGIVPCLLRAAPVNGSIFLAVTFSKRQLEKF